MFDCEAMRFDGIYQDGDIVTWRSRAEDGAELPALVLSIKRDSRTVTEWENDNAPALDVSLDSLQPIARECPYCGGWAIYDAERDEFVCDCVLTAEWMNDIANGIDSPPPFIWF